MSNIDSKAKRWKREKHEVERDWLIISELYLKGHTTRYIAKIVGERVGDGYSITHKTVSIDIRKIIEQWKTERIHDITSQKMIALEKLDRLEETYWTAWEKSVENYTKVTQKVKGSIKDQAPNYREITDTQMREYGEPRYLQGIERCIDKRCKLLGLDAPVKTEVQDNSFLHFLMTTN